MIFLSLIGDFDERLKHSAARSIIADDARVIKNMENVEGSVKLQEALDEIYHWSDGNNMEFNELKLLRYEPKSNCKL